MFDLSLLTVLERREYLELLEQQQRAKARGSLAEFGRMQLGMEPASHHRLIIDELEALERGAIDVLFLFLPPGSAKSTYGSVLFPAWFMGRNPELSVIGVSHTQELIERFGRRVRNIVSSLQFRQIFGVGVSSDSAAARRPTYCPAKSPES
jgi:hypothetical protein